MSETSIAAPPMRKPFLTPRQAIYINLGGLGISVIVGVVACMFYFVPLWQAAACFAVAAFFILAFPWASLDRETKNRTIRAHNLFVYFTIGILIVTLLVQWKPKEEPFPKWAIIAIIVADIAAYSVMARYAIANFQKWRCGSLGSPEVKKI